MCDLTGMEDRAGGVDVNIRFPRWKPYVGATTVGGSGAGVKLYVIRTPVGSAVGEIVALRVADVSRLGLVDVLWYC